MRLPPLNSHAPVLLAAVVLAAIGLSYAPSPARAIYGQDGGSTQTTTPPTAPVPVPYLPAMGTANSNNSMIAVTGVDLTGSSVLFLVDTVNRQLAVYQAMGGSEATQGIKLVAARRIDLDLQLYGLNDKSEYSFEDLQKKFADSKRPSGPVK